MSKKMRAIKVGRESHGMRLVDFLAETSDSSKRRAKSLLDSRRVFVNRKRTWMAKHVLRGGDLVEFPGGRTNQPQTAAIEIVYRESDLLVADKPAGMLAQGRGSIEQHLRERVGNDLAAAHRLDRDTSGAMIFAENQTVLDRMIDLFRRREISKEYLAIVYGRYAGASSHDRRIDGKSALTHTETISVARQASLLRCRIETGRTHQIRKHLAAAGHPVVGDKQYGSQMLDHPVFRRIERQMLHAHRVAFQHPVTGEKVDCRIEPASDFLETARKLSLPVSPAHHP